MWVTWLYNNGIVVVREEHMEDMTDPHAKFHKRQVKKKTLFPNRDMGFFSLSTLPVREPRDKINN